MCIIKIYDRLLQLFKATRMQVISPNCCGAKVTPQNTKLNDSPQVGDGFSIQPVPPLFGDGYDLGGMCLGLERFTKHLRR